MISYKDGRLVESDGTEINKNNPYGYVVMEYDYPHDNELHEAETYEDALSAYNYILKYNPNIKIYIREITSEEFNRAANIRANMEIGEW